MPSHLDRTLSIIECATCEHQISTLATVCPKCGAPNDWKHPDVLAFLSQTASIPTTRRFNFWHDKTAVWGETRARFTWWAWILAALIVSLGIAVSALVSLSWWTFIFGGAASGMVAGAVLSATARKDSFKADLKLQTWVSSNERFWQPVREILKV